MICIGITGGMGSGKTVIASLFEIMGIPVYIADEESKKLSDASPLIRAQLVDLFGESIYTPTGLDRSMLARHIFGNPVTLAQVNAIIHPVVNSHFIEWINRQAGAVCAIESAILFESGFNRVVDYSLMVYAPLEVRIERVLRRGGLAREEVIRRINNQLSDEVKKEKADHVIFNDDIHAIIPQVISFLLAMPH